MLVDGKHYRTLWMQGLTVFIIDQTLLPFEFEIFKSEGYKDSCKAIRTMITRGAGAIGVLGGFAMAQAFHEAQSLNDSKTCRNGQK
ncbi:MAG: hypothetical protein R2764_07940 [Bacteroidales bacterium]